MTYNDCLATVSDKNLNKRAPALPLICITLAVGAWVVRPTVAQQIVKWTDELRSERSVDSEGYIPNVPTSSMLVQRCTDPGYRTDPTTAPERSKGWEWLAP